MTVKAPFIELYKAHNELFQFRTYFQGIHIDIFIYNR
jgi:hypothetical protein